MGILGIIYVPPPFYRYQPVNQVPINDIPENEKWIIAVVVMITTICIFLLGIKIIHWLYGDDENEKSKK